MFIFIALGLASASWLVQAARRTDRVPWRWGIAGFICYWMISVLWRYFIGPIVIAVFINLVGLLFPISNTSEYVVLGIAAVSAPVAGFLSCILLSAVFLRNRSVLDLSKDDAGNEPVTGITNKQMKTIDRNLAKLLREAEMNAPYAPDRALELYDEIIAGHPWHECSETAKIKKEEMLAALSNSAGQFATTDQSAVDESSGDPVFGIETDPKETEKELEKRYGSDWRLETMDRLLVVAPPDPVAEDLWDKIETLTGVRDGLRDETDMLVEEGRDLTSAEAVSLAETVGNLIALLDRLEVDGGRT